MCTPVFLVFLGIKGLVESCITTDEVFRLPVMCAPRTCTVFPVVLQMYRGKCSACVFLKSMINSSVRLTFREIAQGLQFPNLLSLSCLIAASAEIHKSGIVSRKERCRRLVARIQ